MNQEMAKLHWNNYMDCIKKGTDPMFTLPELREYYEKQERNQKNLKSAEARKRKSERKGIKPRKQFDQMTEHKARAIKRLAAYGYKRNKIAETVHISYDKVDSVLRGLTWTHVK